MAIPLESFTARGNVGGTELKEIPFEPAPVDERPAGAKPGTCSHFVAMVPWLKPDDVRYLKVESALDGKPVVIQWRDFIPKKFAHEDK